MSDRIHHPEEPNTNIPTGQTASSPIPPLVGTDGQHQIQQDNPTTPPRTPPLAPPPLNRHTQNRRTQSSSQSTPPLTSGVIPPILTFPNITPGQARPGSPISVANLDE